MKNIFSLRQLEINNLPILRRIFVRLRFCCGGRIVSYVTEATKPKTDKKASKVGGLFVSSCLITVFFSTGSVAGIYKCTDTTGRTSYQAKPCEFQKKAFEMNIQSGTNVNLNQKEDQKKQDEEQDEEQKKQQELEKQQELQIIAQRKKDAIAESAITQTVIKNNPRQYSAFAIPAYNPEKLPALVKQFEKRLPEIEKFRRLAAQKALATGQCQRVEDDQLNIKSQKSQLVFLIDCSSGKSFYYNESELTGQ